MVVGALCDNVRRKNSYYLSIGQMRNNALKPSADWCFREKYMFYSHCKQIFAHNFITKSCLSLEVVLLWSTGVTLRVYCFKKIQNIPSKNSSSFQLLLVTLTKRVWAWTFAAYFTSDFKFPPLFSEKRSWMCVLQELLTNECFSRLPWLPLELSIYNEKFD